MSDEAEARAREMIEGDIFRWHWRDQADRFMPYHCCSCIAVVNRGRLVDTYWGSMSDARSFGVDDLSRIDLEYLGNFADLEKADEWQADYYADADIVNLNHANSTRNNFYLRKGAKRSRVKMLEAARYKLKRSESAERSAAYRSECLRTAIAKIEAGEIEGVHLP